MNPHQFIDSTISRTTMITFYRSCVRLMVIVLAMLVASQTAAQTLGKPATPVLSWNNGGLSWAQPNNGIAVAGHNIFDADTGTYLLTVRVDDGRWVPTANEANIDRFYIVAFDTGAGNTSIYSDNSNVVIRGQPAAPLLSWNNGGLSWSQPNNGIAVAGHNIFDADTGTYLTTVRVDDGRWVPTANEANIDRFYIVAFDTGAGSSAKYSDARTSIR